MGTTSKRGYWFPDGSDEVNNFPGQTDLLFMRKLDTDMDTALTAAIAASRIPNLPASKITSGTFAAARLPAATTSAQGAMSAADKTKLDGIPAGGGGTVTSDNITDATATGRSVITAASAAAARSAIGAGTSSAATGSATELNTGTSTTGRSWSAKVLADYVAANGGGGGGGIGALVNVPRNEDVTTAATELKVAKDSNTGLCFLTAKITCSSSFENGDVIGTLPAGYFTPTSFDKPVYATPQPAMGDKDMSKADYISFNTNNGEIRLTLSEFPEPGMWLGINCIFSENYIGITR